MRSAYVMVAFVSVASTAAAQHRHPAQEDRLHENFYSGWHMPDDPSKSCCNEADCCSPEINYASGNVLREARGGREAHHHPTRKAERNRDNPDGIRHLWAPPPNTPDLADTVF